MTENPGQCVYIAVRGGELCQLLVLSKSVRGLPRVVRSLFREAYVCSTPSCGDCNKCSPDHVGANPSPGPDDGAVVGPTTVAWQAVPREQLMIKVGKFLDTLLTFAHEPETCIAHLRTSQLQAKHKVMGGKVLTPTTFVCPTVGRTEGAEFIRRDLVLKMALDNSPILR